MQMHTDCLIYSNCDVKQNSKEKTYYESNNETTIVVSEGSAKRGGSSSKPQQQLLFLNNTACVEPINSAFITFTKRKGTNQSSLANKGVSPL